MTLFGKILVCLNLVFSLALCAFALGVYTQRINWTVEPSVAQAQSAPEKAAGELAIRRDRIDKLWLSLVAAEARQQPAAANLRQLEYQRYADQQWYAKLLDHMLKDATEKDPVKLLVLRDGKLVPDDKNFGRPTLEDGKDRAKLPLRSYEGYDKDYKENYRLLAEERGRLAKLVEEDLTLTQRTIGPKGLLQRIEDEEDKRQRVEDEIRDFVRPHLINVLVESELLIKRRNALRDRVEELKKVPVAGQ